MNKVQAVLFVTWLWAWIGLKLSKVAELFFTALLSIPNNLLPAIDSNIYNAQGQKIHILNAYTETENIVNKLNIFLRWYWEKGGDDKAHDSNGFDFRRLAKILNCSLLYCSYLVTDKDQKVNPDTFWKDVRRFLVEQRGTDCYISDADGSINEDNSKEKIGKKLFIGHVDFCPEEHHTPNDTSLVHRIVQEIESNNLPLRVSSEELRDKIKI